MPDDIPMISYWMGRPISEMPRDELEREFVSAHRKIAELQASVSRQSIAHINDLARMGRERIQADKGLIGRSFDLLSGGRWSALVE